MSDQFNRTMAIPLSDSNKQASTTSKILPFCVRVIGLGVFVILAGAVMISRCSLPHPYGNAVVSDDATPKALLTFVKVQSIIRSFSSRGV
ncbi:MAG: hypothetical protein WCC17_21950 [Candidatus Nitrosopolaris sp.]